MGLLLASPRSRCGGGVGSACFAGVRLCSRLAWGARGGLGRIYGSELGGRTGFLLCLISPFKIY